MVYLANNKFGELGRNALAKILVWQTGDTECTLFRIHVIISSVGVY